MDGHLDEAFRVLDDALALYKDSEQLSLSLTNGNSTPSSDSSSPTRAVPTISDSRTTSDSRNALRAVAISLKLGDLAETLGKPVDEERCLNFAVTKVLHIVRNEYGLRFQPQGGFVKEEGAQSGSASPSDVPVRGSLWDVLSSDDELDLPAWSSVTRTELAAPFERLAAFNARQGNEELVVPSALSGPTV